MTHEGNLLERESRWLQVRVRGAPERLNEALNDLEGGLPAGWARDAEIEQRLRARGVGRPENRIYSCRDASGRKAIATTCRYLADRTRTRLMRYAGALRDGLPIATGVIEGACRYLVKDRMDRTGARWSLAGAEAVLRLRALRASDDFDDYWRFHLARENERNHAAHYANAEIPYPHPSATSGGIK